MKRPNGGRRWRGWPHGHLSPSARLRVLIAAAVVVVAVVAYAAGWWWPAQEGYGGARPALRPTVLPPDRTFTVDLWDVDYPLGGRPYGALVRDWATAYHKSHPNITVKVTLVPKEAVDGRLTTAKQAGQAPDVFAAPYDWAPLGPEWRVPLTRYLWTLAPEAVVPSPSETGASEEALPTSAARPSREALAEQVAATWTPGALRLLSDESGLQAFPRWYTFWWWVAGGERVEEAGQAPFSDSLARSLVDQLPLWKRMNRRSLVLDALGARAGLSLFAEAGDDAASWEAAADWLQGLVRSGGLLPMQQGKGALLAFAQQQTAAIAGLTPPELAQVMQRLPWAVPVPPPAAKGKEEPLVGATGVYVFYQRPYKGAAHTQAAVQVAYAYSRWRSGEVANSLGVVPATKTGFAAWTSQAPQAWGGAVKWAAAEAAAGRATPFPPAWSVETQRAWTAVRPLFQRLSRGEDVDLVDAVRGAWGRVSR